jgi:hypothetical protein
LSNISLFFTFYFLLFQVGQNVSREYSSCFCYFCMLLSNISFHFFAGGHRAAIRDRNNRFDLYFHTTGQYQFLLVNV